jgi:hypothetical protein
MGNGVSEYQVLSPSRMLSDPFNVEILLVEWRQDGKFSHFILCAILPLLFSVSLVRPPSSARFLLVTKMGISFFACNLSTMPRWQLVP